MDVVAVDDSLRLGASASLSLVKAFSCDRVTRNPPCRRASPDLTCKMRQAENPRPRPSSLRLTSEAMRCEKPLRLLHLINSNSGALSTGLPSPELACPSVVLSKAQQSTHEAHLFCSFLGKTLAAADFLASTSTASCFWRFTDRNSCAPTNSTPEVMCLKGVGSQRSRTTTAHV